MKARIGRYGKKLNMGLGHRASDEGESLFGSRPASFMASQVTFLRF